MRFDARTQQQFEYIEMVLAYEGLITNQQLREKFNITNVQASRILTSYREAFPDNVMKKEGFGRGQYLPTERFVPECAHLTIDRYFQLTRTTPSSVNVEYTQHDFTDTPPELFRTIHSAMKKKEAVKILYRSMNHPDGIERIIHPHAFVFAGRRWHVRAFDEHTTEYRDFNLARVWLVEGGVKKSKAPSDTSWEKIVSLEIRAHPSLSTTQEKLIRDELFNGAIGRRVTTRHALVPYVLRELEVAEDPEVQQPPEYQVYLYHLDVPDV
ncbi:WYL domain-containing protein [Vibrio cholerae]|uniref:WYL domain-containing protein n=3 Tax=Vibrionaceae TaxID=641 RepID=UPI000DE39AB6|nr:MULTISPECIES: WYL domain-containing protein [Vibrio]MBP8548144.1 WYL domain-containing protein [Vibrio paracholerae]MEB5520823.1 WYL domain-containing protein [Vibrio cholerae]MEB5598570.1 WYL domain-containing protein [Vibrio cholerae]RBM86726.1 hypothetical protein DLR73_11605 [Vibrio paracholerae]TXZ36255.1 WYL domain-containing protein [Vibrio cholerae]